MFFVCLFVFKHSLARKLFQQSRFHQLILKEVSLFVIMEIFLILIVVVVT